MIKVETPGFLDHLHFIKKRLANLNEYQCFRKK
jgi:hypothetical protein